jgi:hypothetical protein
MGTAEEDYPGISPDCLQSFILRCWINSDGVQRYRLINARTGQENLFQDIDQLADFLSTNSDIVTTSTVQSD